MPYRRLPNTDKARLRALDNAHNEFLKNGLHSIPYSVETLSVLKLFLPKFKNSIITFDAAKRNQVQKNKDYIELLRKARIYLSHYIQVLNFAIIRKELKADIRSFYDLNKNGKTLPSLNSEKNILHWGKIIIEGDQKRLIKGGNPIYNPSIALVRVNYEKFVEAYRHQKTLKLTTIRSAEIVNNLRLEADLLILNLWNEIEATFEHESEHAKREKSENCGVVYVYRKSEREKMKATNLQSKLSF